MISFFSVIDTFPGPVWVHDVAGRILWSNDTLRRYSVMAGDPEGRHYSERFHPGDGDRLLMAILESVRVGGWTQVKARMRDLAGGYELFLLNFFYYRAPEDGAARWVGLGVAVDERRDLHSAALESEKRQQLALDTAGMAVWDWNVITDTMTWTPQLLALLGVGEPPAIMTWTAFLNFVHEEDRALLQAAVGKALLNLNSFRLVFRIVQESGELRWVSAYGRVTNQLRTPGLDMVGLFYDITREKLQEESRERFIGIASHELRTPVTNIKAYGQLLRQQLEPVMGAEEAGMIDRLLFQTERLSELVRLLLDTTRISEGKLVLERRWFDLRMLVRECVEAVLGPGVERVIGWEDQETGLVYADAERIRQVVVNLLTNAVKFSPAGSRIVVRTWRSGEMVGVAVKDEGNGIEKTMLGKVFDPWVQTGGNRTGLGLGLYISAQIVRQHGGDIGVESEPGKGALFHFIFPAGS